MSRRLTAAGKPDKRVNNGTPHVPTDLYRKQVETLAGYSLNQDQICRVIGIGSTHTLTKHYKAELERGKDLGYMTAVKGLFKNIEKGKEASIFFYLKTQHGWRETNRMELTGADGVPLNKAVDGPPQETYEQWAARVLKEEQLCLEATTGTTS